MKEGEQAGASESRCALEMAGKKKKKTTTTNQEELLFHLDALERACTSCRGLFDFQSFNLTTVLCCGEKAFLRCRSWYCSSSLKHLVLAGLELRRPAINALLSLNMTLPPVAASAKGLEGENVVQLVAVLRCAVSGKGNDVIKLCVEAF